MITPEDDLEVKITIKGHLCSQEMTFNRNIIADMGSKLYDIRDICNSYFLKKDYEGYTIEALNDIAEILGIIKNGEIIHDQDK